MAGFGGRASGAAGAPLAPLVFVLALLIVPTGLGIAWPTGPTPAPSGVAQDAPSAPSANLSIVPSSSWAWVGNASELSAIWATGAVDCQVQPGWFQWTASPGIVSGLLSGGNTSIVNFTGTASVTGNATVTVRSSAAVSCANGTWGRVATATVQLLEIAPLTLGVPGLGPAPAPANATSFLNGSIEGGLPPYQLTVTWGDGTTVDQPLTGAGAFSLTHRFPMGKYAPTVLVTDATGASRTAGVAEWLNAGLSPTGTITPSEPVAEVAVPVQFNALVQGLLPNSFEWFSGCGANVTSENGTARPILCDPSRPGSIPVSLEACSSPVLPMVRERLVEPVRPALSASLEPLLPDGEVARPFPLELTITGGVPPFAVDWSANGRTQPSPSAVPGDGSIRLSLTPTEGGFDPVVLTVLDADGARVDVTNVSVHAESSLNLTLTTRGLNGSAPAAVTLRLGFAGGVSPLSWEVVTNFSFISPTAPGGWTRSPGAVDWEADSWTEGAAECSVEVVDAAGAVLAVSERVGLVPALTAHLSLSAEAGGSAEAVNATVAIAGGVPPFATWLNTSDGTTWNGTLPTDGTWSLLVPVPRAGTVSTELTVLDGGGGRSGAAGLVNLPLPTTPASPTPTPGAAPSGLGPWLGLGLLALIVGGLLLAWVWRRRPRDHPDPSPPSPETLLQEILSPSDGAERVTVELLAEEAGVPLPTVRSTLSRLIAEGRVRSEVSPDGEEVLAWADLPT